MDSDPGVGNERTALAWQRTALALTAGSAIVGRLTFDRLGMIAVASVLTALGLSMWVLIESRRRYTHGAGQRQRPGSRGGRASAALTAATALLAALQLAAIVAAR